MHPIPFAPDLDFALDLAPGSNLAVVCSNFPFSAAHCTACLSKCAWSLAPAVLLLLAGAGRVGPVGVVAVDPAVAVVVVVVAVMWLLWLLLLLCGCHRSRRCGHPGHPVIASLLSRLAVLLCRLLFSIFCCLSWSHSPYWRLPVSFISHFSAFFRCVHFCVPHPLGIRPGQQFVDHYNTKNEN